MTDKIDDPGDYIGLLATGLLAAPLVLYGDCACCGHVTYSNGKRVPTDVEAHLRRARDLIAGHETALATLRAKIDALQKNMRMVESVSEPGDEVSLTTTAIRQILDTE